MLSSLSWMMNILLLTPDNPFPSESGAAIRNYGILRGLSAVGHDLTLLSFTQSELDSATNPLFQICKSVHTVPLPTRSKLKRVIKLITTNRADIEFRLASPKFESQLKDLLRDHVFDVIQFSGIELGSCLPLILSHKKTARVVYDALNAEAELQTVMASVERRLPMTAYSTIQAKRLKRFEKWICQTVDGVIAVSEEDRDFLSRHEGSPIFVVPNGIFVDDYQPPLDRQRQPNQLVFTGKMDYRPNVDAMEWFSARILPRVLRRCPLTELIIVGRNPHPRIQALAAAEHITVTGWVDSVQPYLQAAAVFVVPLRMGSGTRLKILEAMASGCAVVSSAIGAAGLHRDVRQAIEVAADEADFAQIIVSLLQNEERRQELGRQAIRQADSHYDWQVLIPKLLQAYRNIGLG